MNKLRLSLDALEINSFETIRKPEPAEGTVKGYQTETANSGGSCYDPTCAWYLCPSQRWC